MQGSKSSLWTKDFSLLWVSNFNMAMGFYFLLPTLPIFAINSLGADPSQVGYIVGVYTLSALIIRPFAGYALDLIGRRLIYLLSLGLFALLMLSYTWATSLMLLLLIRFVHGISWGITTTAGGTIMADLVPAKRRGEGIGYYGLTMTIAMALGPFIGLWIMGADNFQNLFWASGGLVLIAFFLANFIMYPQVPIQKRTLSWESFYEHRVSHLSLLMFLTTLVYGGVVSFIIIYSDQIGIKNGGIFFLVYAAALSLARPFAGRIFDKQGPKMVLLFGFISLIMGFLILSVSRDIYLFSLASIILGIGNGMVWPSLQTMIINVIEPHRRGVANSTYMSALDLGIGGGSILLGFVAEATSLSTMFFISGLIIILPLAYFLLYAYKDYNSKINALKKQAENK